MLDSKLRDLLLDSMICCWIKKYGCVVGSEDLLLDLKFSLYRKSVIGCRDLLLDKNSGSVLESEDLVLDLKNKYCGQG